MFKKIILLLSLLFAVSEAKVLDAVAVTVDGEAITTAEIKAVREQMNISKKEAIDILIQDRLQQIAVKDIEIPESDVDKKIAMIAQQNNISVPKMQKILKEQGTSWTQYRSNIRKSMKKEKFFVQKVAKEMPEVTDEKLMAYYQEHQNEFIMPTSIDVIEYSAPTKQAMETFMKTQQGLEGTPLSKDTATLNPTLLQMMMQTPNGGFTQPLNAGDRYVVYRVQSKNGQSTVAFDQVKSLLAGKWMQEQREKALKDYFKKMRTGAIIEFIRK
ncbi:peptidyl-prolyl cis-trans isomerase [Sulfurovum sp. zt1-1]|uniref:Peptidyl-prolyl cis-trans isomerase n=1 Tax=Sulfurovum zhangzhouensis TaxID=3019067 RepID=A0ABT7QZZ2_9BACT|nr:peptidyl-prolyl cis-trans isomerase [Sulfurovum zhangzhouensis]MDM5272411.1 peptidyl-prolyl cis-trans isomerase [Sulfurovum zhangzhouensis]